MTRSVQQAQLSMSRKIDFYLHKLEWLGPLLVRGLGLLSSVEVLEQTFSFSQVMVLAALMQHKEITMSGLAEFIGLSRANATGLVDRLVKRGMVERRRVEEDRRIVLIALTQSGKKAARNLAAEQRKGLVRMMKRIPEKDLNLFISTLEQVAMGLVESHGDIVASHRRD